MMGAVQLEEIERIAAAEAYLEARSGKYEWRCVRYDAALEALHGLGLDDDSTVIDVGSGWGEFGVRLHTGRDCMCPPHHGFGCNLIPPSRARYIPVDAGNDGTDLETWLPRPVEYMVALEVVEHMRDPERLLAVMAIGATKGVVVSTPNPETTDVFGMDPTHKHEITRSWLESWGFKVEARSFYGQPDDSLFGVLRK